MFEECVGGALSDLQRPSPYSAAGLADPSPRLKSSDCPGSAAFIIATWLRAAGSSLIGALDRGTQWSIGDLDFTQSGFVFP